MVVTRSEAKQRKEIHVVTGGGGFPGFTLGKRLAQSGHHVRLLDITEPVWELEDGMEFIKVLKQLALIFEYYIEPKKIYSSCSNSVFSKASLSFSKNNNNNNNLNVLMFH